MLQFDIWTHFISVFIGTYHTITQHFCFMTLLHNLPDCLHGLSPGPFLPSYRVFVF